MQLRINQHEQTFKDKPNCGRVQFVVFETFLRANLSQSARDKSFDYYLKWYKQKYEWYLFILISRHCSVLRLLAFAFCWRIRTFPLRTRFKLLSSLLRIIELLYSLSFWYPVDSSNHSMIDIASLTFPPSYVRTVA